jgi:hypothetical protein
METFSLLAAEQNRTLEREGIGYNEDSDSVLKKQAHTYNTEDEAL